jgi:hypothetical protein
MRCSRMPRRRARSCGDDTDLDHAAAAARTKDERTAGELLVAPAVIGGSGRRRRLGGCQQTAAIGDLGDAPAIRKIAVVADAMETVG